MTAPPPRDAGPNAAPPTPPLAWSELPLRERWRIQAVVFIVGSFLAFEVAAYMCDVGFGGDLPCGVAEGLVWGALLCGFGEPLRRWLTRRWPDRRWPDPLVFLFMADLAIMGVVAVSLTTCTAVSVPTPLPSATHE